MPEAGVTRGIAKRYRCYPLLLQELEQSEPKTDIEVSSKVMNQSPKVQVDKVQARETGCSSGQRGRNPAARGQQGLPLAWEEC